MAKHPQERYATAQELADDLRRYLDDRPIQARRPSLRQRAAKWARRHRTVVRAAVVVLALAVVGLTAGTLLVMQERARTAKAEARAATDLAEAEKEARKRLETQLYYQRIALAERERSANNLARMLQLLDECPEDLRGWEWHYLNRLRYKTLPPLRHDGSVFSPVFSPDGRRIAAVDHEGWVKVWDAQTGRELLVFRAPQNQARCVAFSPDGRRLVTGGSDGMVRTWDAKTGREVAACKRHGKAVWSVAFSPDGRYLACAGSIGELEPAVRVWDAATGGDLLRLPASFSHITFSPDSRRLATTDNSNTTVTVWDVPTGRKQLTLGHDHPVGGVAFSPDGRLLASAGGRRYSPAGTVLKVWDAQTGQELLSLRGHTGIVYCVAFSPDGRRLASGSVDQTVKLWDVQTGQEVLTLRGHSGDIRGVEFSPDGHRLVSASHDRTVRVWDATPSAGEPVQDCLTLPGHSGAVTNVAFHPRDHRVLASAGADGTVRVWNAEGRRQLRRFDAFTGRVERLTFSPDGQRLAAAGQKIVRVWDTTTWQEVRPSPLAAKTNLRSVAFSPDGRLLATGGYAKTPVIIWNAATGEPIRELPNKWLTMSVAFHPDGKRLATACNDGTVRVWDVTTGKEIVRPPLRHGTAVASVAFSPDGQSLASASLDRTVKVWDTTTWKHRLVLPDPTGGVWSVAFSPDSKRLAWGSYDGTVKIWDDASEKPHTLRGHTGWVLSVAFSPDGKQIASASSDGTVKIWKAPPVAESDAAKAGNQDP
jgi:WD40 repeat protein